MSGWSDEHEQMLDDCRRRETKLSEWEQQFIDSLDHACAHGRVPSAKQCAVLERIWERVTA